MHGKQFTLTLVLYITLALALLSSVDAHERRNHRILKKRVPQDPQDTDSLGPLPPLVGAQAGPTTTTTTSTTSDTASLEPTEITTTGTTTDTTSLLTTTTTSESTASTTDTTSSTTETTSEATSSSSSITLETTPVAAPVASQGAELVTSVITADRTTRTTAIGASETSASPEKSGATSSTGKSIAITVLIAVGASLGGIVILWTVFRKWKLSRSTKVDQRMQPIDWQPTGYNDMLPGEHRRHSGSSSHHGHQSDEGHGRVPGIPDHDFTAGSNNLAPVGGYADLARGPSPTPQMQEMGSAGIAQPHYDTQVPLHHQGGGYGNDPFNHRF